LFINPAAWQAVVQSIPAAPGEGEGGLIDVVTPAVGPTIGTPTLPKSIPKITFTVFKITHKANSINRPVTALIILLLALSNFSLFPPDVVH